MLTPTIASEQPTDTLPVLAQYLHARLGPLPLRPPVAISFDVDDTLVDTKTSLAHGVRVGSQLAASFTSRVDPDELTEAYHAAFGVFWEHPADTGTYSLHDLRRGVWHTALRTIGVTLDDTDLDRLVHACAAAQLAMIEPDPELRDLLRALADRVPLAVCSNGPLASIREKLNQAGLAEFVTAVICGPDSGLAKPDAGPFLLCSRALKVDPARCLHVGDGWQADVQGAQAAGLTPIWISLQPADTPPQPGTVPRYPTVSDAVRDLLQLLPPDTRTS
jgi:HAD superfamily hydrolase (TIGR01549 family)